MILALALLACDAADKESGGAGDDSAPDDSAADTGPYAESVPLDGACDAADRFGNFTIDANVEYAFVTGQILDGVVPVTVLTEVLSESTEYGTCVIWRKENPYCDPTCNPGYTCDLSEECVPYPVGRDVGTVIVDGLLTDVSMEPVVPGYTYFDTSVFNPPWSAGALVTLQTGGGDFDPVTLYGVAPEPLVTGSLEWVVSTGAALPLSWTPPEGLSRADIRVTLQIDQHGVTPATVICNFEDTGAAQIPASILNELLGLGITGFPNGTIARRSADRAPVGEGCADLWLTSSFLPSITVDGYTPCKADAECTPPQTCNEELERCE